MTGHTRTNGGACSICGNPTAVSDDQEYKRCPTCGVVRTRFDYNPKVYDQSYAINYVAYAESEVNIPLNLFRLGLVSRWLRNGQRILDVGCCIGEFIRFAEHYYECIGFEPNSYALTKARTRVNSKVLGDLNGSTSKVNCITLFDVLEHIQEPAEFLGFLSEKYLLPNGIIAITTPNVAAVPMWNWTEMKKWKHYKPEEHLYLYTESGLQSLCERVGLKPIHWGVEESDIRPGNPNGDILTCVARKAS